VLNLERLRVLRAVADAGSLAAAGRELHLSESAVSQQLARLRVEIGHDLFVRSGRRLVLTAKGERLADYARRLIDDATAALDDICRSDDHVTGQVRIAAFATAARALVPRALVSLRELAPQLVVSLDESEPDEAIPRLLRGEFDVVISNEWSDRVHLDRRLSRTALKDDPVVVALPASHRLARRRRVALSELAKERWIAWPIGTLCRTWLP